MLVWTLCIITNNMFFFYNWIHCICYFFGFQFLYKILQNSTKIKKFNIPISLFSIVQIRTSVVMIACFGIIMFIEQMMTIIIPLFQLCTILKNICKTIRWIIRFCIVIIFVCIYCKSIFFQFTIILIIYHYYYFWFHKIVI